MAFLVSREVCDLFPGMILVVAVAEGVDNRRPNPTVQESLAGACVELGSDWAYPNAQSHPHVRAWGHRFALTQAPSVALTCHSVLSTCPRRAWAWHPCQ